MLEFEIARKYLLPSRRKLSASLISILSCGVISLVIWLLLLFLSVTDGIEKNWLTKMTTLNSPIRITPTQDYFRSYYYQVDSISAASGYHHKTIKEKLLSDLVDPYDREIDEQIPLYWPKMPKNSLGQDVDIVKTAFSAIESTGAKAQEYEVTTAMLRLQLLRKKAYAVDESYISQASYLANFNEESESLKHLLLKPQIEDINHLLYLSEISKGDFASFAKRILPYIEIKKATLDASKFQLPLSIIPKKTSFKALAYVQSGSIKHIILPINKEKKLEGYEEGALELSENGELHFLGKTVSSAPIFLDASPLLSIEALFLDNAASKRDIVCSTHFSIQGHPFKGNLSFEHLSITEGSIIDTFDSMPEHEPLWPYIVENKVHIPLSFGEARGVLVPKALKNSGTKLGDRGALSYSSFTGTTSQEMKYPIFVAGFYDPGAMAIGSRYILARDDLVATIAASNNSEALDPMMSSGIQVLLKDIKETPKIVAKLKESFKEAGIASYFNIIPYYEFEFARDLILQLQSDRYLFTLVGIIILVVACSNIISLLLLLVNDKKKEIGILKAMGASTSSIVVIFAVCGLLLGTISFGFGISAAYFTLKNIDSIAHFLSLLQGHQAFNPDIYGQNLPTTLSTSAVIAMAIATPIVSLIAGLIPAIKAARLSPSEILKKES
jgi:lipoprotein-releasing system permease protein